MHIQGGNVLLWLALLDRIVGKILLAPVLVSWYLCIQPGRAHLGLEFSLGFFYSSLSSPFQTRNSSPENENSMTGISPPFSYIYKISEWPITKYWPSNSTASLNAGETTLASSEGCVNPCWLTYKLFFDGGFSTFE